MLNVLRSGLRRAAHAPRYARAQPRTSAARASLRTQARAPSSSARTAALSVAAAGAALSGVVIYGGVVRLDSADSPKPKPRAKPATKQPEENTPSEIPQTSTAEAEPVILTPDVDASGSPEDGTDTDADAEGDAGSGSGGAYNPETGEINWDCPCLGGMAHGPCGQEFRAAFSCFVYSEDEPKGINCVELFKQMQDCFRAHPEVYGEEIMADDEEDGVPAPAGGADSSDGSSEPVSTPASEPELVPVPVSSSS